MNAIPDEQAALLRAIVGHIDDDAPRLVYADWLEEHGDAEQAGFIRDSIRLAGMGKRAKGRKALAERLAELANKRGGAWCDAVVGSGFRVARYGRGFPECVTFDTLEDLFAVADPLFARLPVRGLAVESDGGAEAALKRLAALPGLTRLTDLRLYHHDSIAAEDWEAFFRSPLLSGLTHLTLGNCGIYEEEAAHLAASPMLANLVSLDLGYNSIGVGGAQAILDSPHLTKLEALWLEHNFFGEEEDEDAVLEALEMRFGDGLQFDPPEDDDE